MHLIPDPSRNAPPSQVMQMPAGGKISFEIACNKEWTSYGHGSNNIQPGLAHQVSLSFTTAPDPPLLISQIGRMSHKCGGVSRRPCCAYCKHNSHQRLRSWNRRQERRASSWHERYHHLLRPEELRLQQDDRVPDPSKVRFLLPNIENVTYRSLTGCQNAPAGNVSALGFG
jgi:hypothetical protein